MLRIPAQRYTAKGGLWSLSCAICYSFSDFSMLNVENTELFIGANLAACCQKAKLSL